MVKICYADKYFLNFDEQHRQHLGVTISKAQPEDPAKRKISALYDELNVLRQVMRKEISSMKALQSTITEQEKSLKDLVESIKFYGEEVKRRKREKDAIESKEVPADVSYHGAAALFAEEREQDKKRIGDQIKRWEELLTRASRDLPATQNSIQTNRAELNATVGALLAHDAMRKQLVNSLNEVEASEKQQMTPPSSDLITQIESGIQDRTDKEIAKSRGRKKHHPRMSPQVDPNSSEA
ncbi:hypothetical protein FRC17_005133 [Serendipita sp. 399]|nr:hypothetical protein FRC17_005133 [Serendipita sp. 399]